VYVLADAAASLIDGRSGRRTRWDGYRVLVLAAAWTGMRSGVLFALQRPAKQSGGLWVDPRVGNLKPAVSGFMLGAPKTAAGSRFVELPPFLDELIDQLLTDHDSQWIFCTPQHARLNSANWDNGDNWDDRVWRPICDGDPRPRVNRAPIWPGLEFYELRHSHET
jgi:integrase